jgi:hypothetical protein
MNTFIRVSPLVADVQVTYDLFLCAVGYEERSSFAAKKLNLKTRVRVGIGFDYHKVGRLSENIEYFSSNGFLDWASGRSPHVTDIEFAALILELFKNVFETSPNPRLAVDISSFSSVRLAKILECVTIFASDRTAVVDFYYTLGDGYDNKQRSEEIEFSGPVTEFFAGWSSEPELPVTAIFCLGKEYDRAIGAFELLNPSLTFVFATSGALETLSNRILKVGPEFNGELARLVRDANRQLLPLVPTDKRFEIDLKKPYECYTMVKSVVSGAVRFGRAVAVPLGPKLFTLIALLTAIELNPRMAVWRFSVGRSGEPQDVRSSGHVVGLSVCFSPER